MQFLMLMWADAEATGGDESDFRAWADFDEQVWPLPGLTQQDIVVEVDRARREVAEHRRVGPSD